MGNGLPTHGREGVLYLSTSTGSTSFGTEVGYSNEWNWSPSKDQAEISRLNQNSKEFIEGMVGGSLAASGSLMVSLHHHVNPCKFWRCYFFLFF